MTTPPTEARATLAGVHLDVPEPPTSEGEVIGGYLVQVATGSYPASWRFSDTELDEAVEKWADEGMDRCNLYAEGVRMSDYGEEPVDVRALFFRRSGWDKWEVC